MRCIALLRGVNVGGHGRIAMADLRGVCGELGWPGASTYLQSGNVLLDVSDGDPATVGPTLEAALRARLGVPAAVLVLSAAGLAAVARANPFAAAGLDPATVHITFLAGPVSPARLAALPPDAGLPDRFAPGPQAIYLHCPGGYGRTKLHNGFFETRLGVPATTRNWRTVQALVALAEA